MLFTLYVRAHTLEIRNKPYLINNPPLLIKYVCLSVYISICFSMRELKTRISRAPLFSAEFPYVHFLGGSLVTGGPTVHPLPAAQSDPLLPVIRQPSKSAPRAPQDRPKTRLKAILKPYYVFRGCWTRKSSETFIFKWFGAFLKNLSEQEREARHVEKLY